MKPITGKRMCKVLESRGWRLDRITGSHHVYLHEEFPRAAIVPVHGHHDLKPGTQRDIMRAARLTDADL